MPYQSLKQQRCPGITPRRRQQDDLQVHNGVQHPAGHGQSSPTQQRSHQHTASQGTGQGQKQQALPEQPSAAAIGSYAHQRQYCQAAEHTLQESRAGQKYSHGIAPAHNRTHGKAQTAQRLPRQTGSPQQQNVVHKSIEQKQGIHIDYRHRCPPSSLSCPVYREAGLHYRQAAEKIESYLRGKNCRSFDGPLGIFLPAIAFSVFAL